MLTAETAWASLKFFNKKHSYINTLPAYKLHCWHLVNNSLVTAEPGAWPHGAHLQEAVLAAEKLILLRDGLSGQEQLILTESRLALAREDCLGYQKEIRGMWGAVLEEGIYKRQNNLTQSELLATCDVFFLSKQIVDSTFNMKVKTG